MKSSRIAFIGAGNMARSLIGGLITDGWDPANIRVSDPSKEQLANLRSHFPVLTDTSNLKVIEDCDALLLAVKPQVIKEVALDLADSVRAHQPLVISIAAGIRSTALQHWLGGYQTLVRCMPNTPALVQSGATALFSLPGVSAPQKDLAETILRAAGLALWVEDESQLDAVTALSGSGPAYFFLVIEALQAAGESLGLNQNTARLLAVQTAFGSAKMALESSEDAAMLRTRVTSPGGTTEKALEVLEAGDLRALFEDALRAAHDRSITLAEQFGAQ